MTTQEMEQVKEIVLQDLKKKKVSKSMLSEKRNALRERLYEIGVNDTANYKIAEAMCILAKFANGQSYFNKADEKKIDEIFNALFELFKKFKNL